MALKKATTFRGLPVPEGYHRIGALRFDAPGSLYIRIDTFVDAKSAEAGEQPVSSQDMHQSLESIDATKATLSMKKVYAALRAMDDFADAVDV
jgi:hypothetical protein